MVAPRLVLLGKQGAGKGTQGKRLAEHYGVPHLSTGEMFRAQAVAGTAFGLEARRYMDEGELVPDDVVIGVIEECVAPGGPLSNGFVLDGFPRTLAQAAELNRLLDGHPIDVAVNLDVPTEIVLDRLAGRRVCEVCQRVYHVNMPPKSNWTCDDDGGPVVQRPDDTEEAVLRRLELYDTETVPIIDYYFQQERLSVVDGVGDGDDVFARIIEAVETATAKAPR
jgi:adenylate kinase